MLNGHGAVVQNLWKSCDFLAVNLVETFPPSRLLLQIISRNWWKTALLVHNFRQFFLGKFTALSRYFTTYNRELFHTFHKVYYDDDYILIKGGNK